MHRHLPVHEQRRGILIGGAGARRPALFGHETVLVPRHEHLGELAEPVIHQHRFAILDEFRPKGKRRSRPAVRRAIQRKGGLQPQHLLDLAQRRHPVIPCRPGGGNIHAGILEHGDIDERPVAAMPGQP